MLAQQKSASSSKCLHSFGSLRTHSSGVKVFHPSPKALFAKISSFQGFNSPQNPHCISPEETPMCSAPPGQPALLPAPCAGLPWLQTAHAAQRDRVCPVKAPNPHKAQAPKVPRANQTFVNKSRSAKSTHRWKAFTNRRISLKSLIKYCNSLHTSSSQWPRHFNWKGVWLRFFFPLQCTSTFKRNLSNLGSCLYTKHPLNPPHLRAVLPLPWGNYSSITQKQLPTYLPTSVSGEERGINQVLFSWWSVRTRLEQMPLFLPSVAVLGIQLLICTRRGIHTIPTLLSLHTSPVLPSPVRSEPVNKAASSHKPMIQSTACLKRPPYSVLPTTSIYTQ